MGSQRNESYFSVFSETIGSVGYQLKKEKTTCDNTKGSTNMKRSTAPLECARLCSFREEESLGKEFVLYDNPESDVLRCKCVEDECYEEENPKATLYTITIDEGELVIMLHQSGVAFSSFR